MTAPPPTPTPSPTTGAIGGITPDQWATLGKGIQEAFTNNSAQTVIALLALVLSLIALVNQFSRGRKADLSVYFAKTPDFKYSADRLVITNYGAASAKHIRLVLTIELEARPAETRNGVEMRKEQKGGKQSWEPYKNHVNPFPIQVLAPGASFYIPITVYGHLDGEAPFALAKLTWRDRRLRRQSWESTVSSTGQPLGGPNIANFLAEQQSRSRSLAP